MDPITASESGQNAYYLGNCKFVEHNPPYAACLDKIKRVKAGEKGVPTCCVEAIKHGTCQAADMRKKEEFAGRALYFIQREKLEEGLVKAPPWSVPETKSPVTERPVTERPVPELTEGQKAVHGGMRSSGAFSVEAAVSLAGSYADAINAAMQETAAAPAATPAPTPAPPAPTSAFARFKSRPQPLPGESPIAYAKRCAAHKESQ